MKYVPPYGRESEGDLAHYINGNPKEGTQGSIPPANAFEHPMRELVGVISKSNITPSPDDLMQVTKGVRSQYLNWAIDTGSTNNLSVAFDPPLGSYTVGLTLRVRVNATNTGQATIDAGGTQGRVAIRRMGGTGLAPGDLVASGIVELVYDGTGFQMVNYLGTGGTGTVTNTFINIPYCVEDPTSPASGNVVIAVFPTPPPTLTAGDPFLVKMLFTNTGSAVLRIKSPSGFHPDKPIKANGGDVLLQGDMQVGDVVLFIYDGSNFWIYPNPIINADTTINVPAQYATVPDALLAIRRKTIAQNARVTVLIDKTPADPTTTTNIIAPFKINHANADRITIRGVLKIAGTMTTNDFAQTGNSQAARDADSQTNIFRLRQRYGVEVQVPVGGNASGIENIGPGNPLIQDILITGPNYWSSDPIGRWIGVYVSGGRFISMSNISAWGLDIGFYGSGVLSASYCFTSHIFRFGALATSLGSMSFANSGCFGGALNGFASNQNSFLGTSLCWANNNANVGAYATDNSELTFHTSQAIGNAVKDCMAGILSLTMVLNSTAGGGVGTVSPTPGAITSDGAMLVWQP